MKRNGNTIVTNWIKIADYDLQTSKAMYDTGRYIYVAFLCQQSIEKLLKAMYVNQKGETPPYTHNLIRLLELIGLQDELNEEQKEYVNLLNAYYIKARYSEQIDKLKRTLNKKKSLKLLEHTESFSKWIKNKIK